MHQFSLSTSQILLFSIDDCFIPNRPFIWFIGFLPFYFFFFFSLRVPKKKTTTNVLLFHMFVFSRTLKRNHLNHKRVCAAAASSARKRCKIVLMMISFSIHKNLNIDGNTFLAVKSNQSWFKYFVYLSYFFVLFLFWLKCVEDKLNKTFHLQITRFLCDSESI